jgi:pyruvate dehydrogenase E1 component alpha subunit
VEARWQDDPIARLGQHLRLAGVTDSDLAEDIAAAEAEMARAYDEALATPYPAAADAFAHVQDIGDPRTEAY